MPDTRADDSDPYVLKVVEPFEGFFDREYPRMVAVAYAVSGSRWAAEELAQEACLRAYRSWDKVSGYDKPGAWLRRVTINLATSLRSRPRGVPLGRILERLTIPVAFANAKTLQGDRRCDPDRRKRRAPET